MSYYSSRKVVLPLSIGILGVITIFISELIVFTQDSKIVEISWLSSVFITISAVIIRFYSINISQFVENIQKTNPIANVKLILKRFLNGMTLAMIIGLVVTITIHFNFIAGFLVYLVM